LTAPTVVIFKGSRLARWHVCALSLVELRVDAKGYFSIKSVALGFGVCFYNKCEWVCDDDCLWGLRIIATFDCAWGETVFRFASYCADSISGPAVVGVYGSSACSDSTTLSRSSAV
jgi:hypothetical protein